MRLVDFKVAVCMVNVILLHSGLSYSCGRAEYEIDGECCPMCPSGTHVYKHCTEYTNTTCVQCIGKTFIDEPNGLPSCRPCKVCHAGLLSLKVDRECTPSSDTVCGPLAQHYCIEPHEKGCGLAQRHTVCKPGQFIKQNGTAFTDTICEECPDNTFSDGLSTSCKPHTICQSLGLIQRKKGNQFTDSECREHEVHVGLILGGMFGLLLLCSSTGVLIFILHRKKRRKQNPETQPKEEETMIQQPQDGGEGETIKG
ncbi:hypothetical protein AAFF_G00392850 [Aldrovandia affinis]|uniref:TNFR-Cys domain-containing protein n=1 Tax=Aldrovandia affinis TaxID=143900 RepID=A0AAD7R3W5_9TELE|nr:hypothetical protein AAFF_G00392850 [Aldrovandia affinis]